MHIHTITITHFSGLFLSPNQHVLSNHLLKDSVDFFCEAIFFLDIYQSIILNHTNLFFFVCVCLSFLPVFKFLTVPSLMMFYKISFFFSFWTKFWPLTEVYLL